MSLNKTLKINRHLFYQTSHSPSLADIVGLDMLDKVHDFCFIANPYYPDKRLIKLLQEKLPVLIKSYPSSNPMISKGHLAAVLHVQPETLIIGNGATELITVINNHFIDEVAIPVPTFSEYLEKLRSDKSAKLYKLPADKNYKLDLNDYADWIDANQITAALIINPGNPTGELKSLDEMKSFLQRMKHLKMVIVDESFIDFAGENIPSLLPFIDEFSNLMIVRSMSKHCGVPGLRLGYCCSSNKEFIEKMKLLVPIWNINTLAEYFLTQLHKTDANYHKARMKVIRDVDLLYNELKSINGFYVYPSGTNFLLIKCTCGHTATDLQHLLLEKYHCYVRDCSNKVGLDQYHIRVASQGKAKDKVLVKALKEISVGIKN
jgi:histidinol-phosphate/aromatic aminotransferase/cobyric acid decarboxylase-like protein